MGSRSLNFVASFGAVFLASGLMTGAAPASPLGGEESTAGRAVHKLARQSPVVGTPASASANSGRPAIPDARAALEGIFRTVDGDVLGVLSDDAAEGERTVMARSGSGELIRYVIQSSSVTEEDRKRMLAEMLVPRAHTDGPGYSEVAPGPETFDVKAAPLSPDLTWTPVSVVATTENVAAITWNEPGFTVSAAGLKDMAAREGEVVFENLEPGHTHTMTLTSTAGAAEEVGMERQRTVEVTTLPSGADAASARTHQKYTTAYIHKAFIMEDHVSAMYCLNWPTRTFGGDDRGYAAPSLAAPNEPANYRTMMFGNVNWDNPAPYDFRWTRNVGASRIYDNGALIATLYADTSQMVVKGVQVGSTYAKAYFDQWSPNPHCKAGDVNYPGAIRFAEWVEYYRSGTVAVDGYRFKAPNHEMYARFNTVGGGDVWRTMALRPNEGFKCLLGNICGMDFYQRSISY